MFSYLLSILFNKLKINNTKTSQNYEESTYDYKDDYEDVFFDLQQVIHIRQFLSNEQNLKKVIDFYKKSTGYLDAFKSIFTSHENKYKTLNKEEFLNVYDFALDYDLISYKKIKNTNKYLKVNLLKLYNSRLFEVGENTFDINNNNKYFPLKYGDLCFMTNFAKLNVIVWLIEMGFYNCYIDNKND